MIFAIFAQTADDHQIVWLRNERRVDDANSAISDLPSNAYEFAFIVPILGFRDLNNESTE